MAMQKEFEPDNPQQILLRSIALDIMKTPFLSQWTYGAEWSKARILVAKAEHHPEIDPPSDEVDALKFEIHYREWFGIAYFGFARMSIPGRPLNEIISTLKAIVTRGASAADAVRLVMSARACECTFRECVFGVANAWLENPRITVPPGTPFTLAGLEGSIADVMDTFRAGTINPIMCEIIDPERDVWLAFQISNVQDGLHFVEANRARRIFVEILHLN